MNNAYIRAQQCKVKEAKFPFVKIGTQYWTTKNLNLAVTPQGNTIREMQANGNVEKVVNGGFDTDTVWNKTGAATIGSGIARVYSSDGSGSSIYQIFSSIGRYCKLTYTIIANRGGQIKTDSANGSPTLDSSVGTHIYYFLSISNILYINRAGGFTDIDLDNISCQQIGWSGSQELYDGIYAQTSGTVEQKTYAAVKAAAMWSNYNNDDPTGLIYGKLYNWFAVKLFQMDIDYYNAANPTKPYIWRVPTQAEFQTLSTYLGGDSVSGGHLKEIGTVHWSSPNTGADNSSGFTALGSGYRDGYNESYTELYYYARFWHIDNGRLRINLDNSITLGGSDLRMGHSIRLIKA